MSNSEEVELKSCPFCGNQPEYFNHPPQVWCKYCCYSIEDECKEAAIKSWNIRTPEPLKETCKICHNSQCRGDCLSNIYASKETKPPKDSGLTYSCNHGEGFSRPCPECHPPLPRRVDAVEIEKIIKEFSTYYAKHHADFIECDVCEKSLAQDIVDHLNGDKS